MKRLRDYIADANSRGAALGHFNFSNLETLWGIFNAAKKLSVPVIVGTSEGERDFVGVPQAVALVRSLREQYQFPIFLNADHTYSFDKVKEAIDAGYDAVIFDGTELSLEENIKVSAECVRYARAAGRDVIVEGELGFIGKSSKILEGLPPGVKLSPEFLTKPEDAKRFVVETGVDLIAPAVGNIHGMLRGGSDPALDISRIAEIHQAVAVPLVLHGGSGNSDGDFKKAIENGVAIIHINTELRVAYKKGLTLAITENPDEIAPYKYGRGGMQMVEKVVEEKLRLFNNL